MKVAVSGCGKASVGTVGTTKPRSKFHRSQEKFPVANMLTCHYDDRIGAQVMLDTRIPKGDNFTDEAAEAASSKDKCSMLMHVGRNE